MTSDIIELLSNTDNKNIRKSYSYLLGIVLGDGSLWVSKKHYTTRLRISCDINYPNIIKIITKSINNILPKTKVSNTICHNDNGKPSWIDVQCYSKHLIQLFPFFKTGKKSDYKIELIHWQKSIVEEYPQEFWLGLFHTDGCRTPNRKRFCYAFAQKSEDIMNLFLWASKLLGVEPKLFLKTNNGYSKSYIYVASIYKKDSVKYLDSFAGPKN